MTVMLMLTIILPPVFVAVMVYTARVSSSIGVPLRVPFEVWNVRPFDTDGLIDQEIISPGPVMVGKRGSSLLRVLLTKFNSFGE